MLLALVLLLAGLGGGLYTHFNKPHERPEFTKYPLAQYPSSTGLPLARFYLGGPYVPGNPEFVSDCELSDQAHAPVMVYRVNNPDVTEQWLVDLARELEVLEPDEEPSEVPWAEENYSEIYGSEGRLRVAVDSGYFSCSYDAGSTAPSQDGMIGEEQAENIATSFLEEKGLLPDSWVCSGVEHASSYAWAAPLDWSVSFTWMLGDLPVIGQVKLRVLVSREGYVTKVLRYCRETEPYQVFSNTRSPLQAFHDMIARIGGDWDVNAAAAKVVVTEVKVGYYMQWESERQDYVVPVYQFIGEGVSEEGDKVANFAGYCNVLY